MNPTSMAMRRACLLLVAIFGALLPPAALHAGGAGVEYYFGYALPENDLVCEDFRSRDKSWDYCRIALDFFRAEKIPFWEMANANALIGNAKDDNSKFCFAKAGELFLVYLPDGGSTDLDLTDANDWLAVIRRK